MDINKLTIGELKELRSVMGGVEMDEKTAIPMKIGKSYLIRTVTVYALGQVKRIDGDWVTLEYASYIADTGRFNDTLANGINNSSSSEVEPFVNDVVINSQSIVDYTLYEHPLPNEVK